MNWLLKMASQPSTWRGCILIITAFGVAISDVQAEAIIAAGLALAGCVGAFVSD